MFTKWLRQSSDFLMRRKKLRQALWFVVLWSGGLLAVLLIASIVRFIFAMGGV